VDSGFGLDATGGIPGSFYYDDFYMASTAMESFFCVDKAAVRQRGIMSLTDAQVHGPELCFIVRPTKYKPLFYYPTALSLYFGAKDLPLMCTCPRDLNNPGTRRRTFPHYPPSLPTPHALPRPTSSSPLTHPPFILCTAKAATSATSW
jgi:hypothetical protein